MQKEKILQSIFLSIASNIFQINKLKTSHIWNVCFSLSLSLTHNFAFFSIIAIMCIYIIL